MVPGATGSPAATPAVPPRATVVSHRARRHATPPKPAKKVVTKPYVKTGPVRFPEPMFAGGNSMSVVNIKASLILGSMDKAYHALNTFIAKYDARGSDNSGEGAMHATIGFSRNPERAFAFVTDPSTQKYVYDGTHIVIFPAPDADHFTMIDNVWEKLSGSGIGTVFGRLVDNPQYDILSRMVTSGFKAQVDLGAYDTLDALENTDVDGTKCDRIQSRNDQCSITMMIGHKDHLLRRVTWVNFLPEGKTSYFIENYSYIQIDPKIPDSTFIFKPPKGVTLFTTVN